MRMLNALGVGLGNTWSREVAELGIRVAVTVVRKFRAMRLGSWSEKRKGLFTLVAAPATSYSRNAGPAA